MVHEYTKEMNQKAFPRESLSVESRETWNSYSGDIFTVGAPALQTISQNRELKTVFKFELMDIDSSDPLEPLIPTPRKISDLKNVVEK